MHWVSKAAAVCGCIYTKLSLSISVGASVAPSVAETVAPTIAPLATDRNDDRPNQTRLICGNRCADDRRNSCVYSLYTSADHRHNYANEHQPTALRVKNESEAEIHGDECHLRNYVTLDKSRLNFVCQHLPV